MQEASTSAEARAWLLAPLRNMGCSGDGAANWSGNADAFADGASSGFGSATPGTGTVSVYATYTTLGP